jgi:hypothetical protein
MTFSTRNFKFEGVETFYFHASWKDQNGKHHIVEGPRVLDKSKINTTAFAFNKLLRKEVQCHPEA